MEFRDARPSDLSFVLEGLEKNRVIEGRSATDAAATPDDARQYEARIGAKTVRVLEEGGAPIGFLSFELDLEVMYVPPPALFIDLVYVREDQRGRGLGRRLYEEAAALARQHGCDKIVADVFADNEGSARFHRRVGFEPVYTIFQKPVR